MGLRPAPIRDWLMHAALVDDPSDGTVAVASWLEPDGRPHAVYPEIAGYYAQFLAQQGCDARSAAVARALAAWLQEIGRHGPPPTFLYNAGSPSPWRDASVFVFDLAMIVRGLVQLQARWPTAVAQASLESYGRMAMAIQADGRLTARADRVAGQVVAVPERWSTRPTPHLVKAAEALAHLGDPAAVRLADATTAYWLQRVRREGPALVGELHPALYFVEGALQHWWRTGDAAALAMAVRVHSIALERIERALADDGADAARADALAQALRAGYVLAGAGAIDGPGWRRRAGPVADRLGTHVLADGGVAFMRDGSHRNVWCALFAWQAAMIAADPPETTASAAAWIRRLI